MLASDKSMNGLFQLGKITLHGGQQSDWKIECDSLSDNDWKCLAKIATGLLPPFGEVEGVPRGGLLFADALRLYSTHGPLLIADDVCTTGISLENHRADRDVIGVVAFSRGSVPAWVIAVFELTAKSIPKKQQVETGCSQCEWVGTLFIKTETGDMVDDVPCPFCRPPRGRSKG